MVKISAPSLRRLQVTGTLIFSRIVRQFPILFHDFCARVCMGPSEIVDPAMFHWSDDGCPRRCVRLHAAGVVTVREAAFHQLAAPPQ
jgi:hypothetical protein